MQTKKMSRIEDESSKEGKKCGKNDERGKAAVATAAWLLLLPRGSAFVKLLLLTRSCATIGGEGGNGEGVADWGLVSDDVELAIG